MNKQKFFKLNKEKIIVGLLIIAVTFISFLPAAYGYFFSGPDYKFFGASREILYDYPVYLSMIEQARQGKLLFENLYTTEPQNAVLFSPLWLFLGLVGRASGLSNIFLFYFSRLLLMVSFLIFLYFFLSKFFTSLFNRLTCFILLIFSSGIGVLFIPAKGDWDFIEIFYTMPVDLWVAESNTFTSLYHSALFIGSQFLIVAIFYLFLSRLNRKRITLLALLALLLSIIHPYDVITVSVVPFVYLIVSLIIKKKLNWPQVKAWLTIILFSLPAGGYYIFIVLTEKVVGQWAKQNLTLSGPLFNYLIGYGFILLFAIFGAILIIRQKKEKFYFIITWAITSGLLLYAPLDIQRRFSNGLHIALVLLATVAVVYFWQGLKKEGSGVLFYLVPFFLAPLFFLSNLAILTDEAVYYQQKKTPWVISNDDHRAGLWLKNNSIFGQSILSSTAMGNLLPAFSGRHVYLGHGHQTVNFFAKKEIIENWFFRTDKDKDNEEKEKFLKDNNIDYLWYSDEEKKLGSFQPATKKYLEKIYSNNSIEIYQIK